MSKQKQARNTLDFGQKVKVYEYLKEHAEVLSGMDKVTVAKAASEAVGFEVNTSNVSSIAKEAGVELKVSRSVTARATVDQLASSITNIKDVVKTHTASLVDIDRRLQNLELVVNGLLKAVHDQQAELNLGGRDVKRS